MHYASMSNGHVYMAIPGILFFFSTPHDHLGNLEWADDTTEDCQTVHRFGPGFTAALLSDLAFSVAACLDKTSPAAANALTV